MNHSLSTDFVETRTTVDIKKWRWWRFSLPPLAHLFGDVGGWIFYPEALLARYSGPQWYIPYLRDWVIMTGGLLLITEGNVHFYAWMDRRYPWEQTSGRRLMLQIGFSVTWAIIVALIMAGVFLSPDFGSIRQESISGIGFLSILVTAVIVIVFFFQKMKLSIIESERLKSEARNAQEQILRQQTDPHFLFNSLNTLINLIMDDQKQAVDFVQKLSRVYRYVLQSKDLALVSLAQEVEFVNDYAYMYSQRFAGNFTFSANIPSEFNESLIPPLTLQILLENCIKHNIVSQEKPLYVSIEVESGRNIVVWNNLQRKSSINPSTGTGLKNIVSRYELLQKGIVEISETSSEYIVRVPIVWNKNQT
jgi:hypothetical protein